MPSWLIKSAIHRAISLLPQSQKWNEWFQKHVTKSLDLGPGAFEARLNSCRQFLEDLLVLRPECAGQFSALELGTGWHPVVPIGLYLCGASEIWCFDIDPLLSASRLKILLNYFCDYDRKGILRKFLPRMRPERLALLHELLKNVEKETPAASLKRLNLHVVVRDAQTTGLPSESIDLFFSYSVLEYIPAGILANLFAEFKRLSRKNAVMIHYVDLFDQFSVFDKSITPLNFLKFSSARWRWLRSPLIPANRLRMSEYRALLSAGSFQITRELNTSAPVEKLNGLPLAPEFQKFPPKDLLVITSWVVSRRP